LRNCSIIFAQKITSAEDAKEMKLTKSWKKLQVLHFFEIYFERIAIKTLELARLV
jgi:hypothetical protein